MNIYKATTYAIRGHRIYRSPGWLDSDTGEIAKSIHIAKSVDGYLLFMFSKSYIAILTPEDCIADDWEIMSNEN